MNAADLTDEEAKLLQSLEDEGLLSKNVAARVRTALRIGNVAGKKRTRIVTGMALMILATVLASACYFFCGTVGWAAMLTGSNALLSGCTGFYLVAESGS